MNLEHSFNIKLAQEHSIEEAILLKHIYFWVKKNEANDKAFKDNRYWTYNSARAFQKLFPYWSQHQIRRIIKKLIDKGLLIKGTYNKESYDKTSWYSLTEKAISYFEESLSRNREMELAISLHGSNGNATPIPDIKEDMKEDNKEYYVEIVTYLNEKTNSNYSYKAKKTQQLINVRLAEGRTVDDFKTVIDNMVREWTGATWESDGRTVYAEQYLRPSTLFSENFDRYLNVKNIKKLKTSEEEDLKAKEKYYGKIL